MKCVLIVSPGEIVEGQNELEKLGYDVETYPSTQYSRDLKDSRVEEFVKFLGFHPRERNSRYVRSLRKSFANMICDPRYMDDEWVIFGESDATPVAAAKDLKPAIQKVMQENPDTDVIRLFYNYCSGPSNPPSVESHWQFDAYKTWEKTMDQPYVWGTHALVIPVKSRAKVAQIFSTCQLPIDTALEVANYYEELKVRVARHNLFYQKHRSCRYSPDAVYDARERKIAVCLSSYKRLEDLVRQIYCMMNQTYSNFHLFVAVKGITENVHDAILMEYFRHFIEDGRLTLRLFPNKNQLSNFVDTVRDLDISEYELFAKIDDDDFYGLEYVDQVNRFHSMIPAHHSSRVMKHRYISSRAGFSTLEENHESCLGSSMVLTREAMELLMECEKNPHRIKELLPAGEHEQHWGYKFGFAEDNMMRFIMNQKGWSSRDPFLDEEQSFHYIVQRSNASVMRGNLVNDEFRQEVDDIREDSPLLHEHVLALEHPEWNDVFVMRGTRGYRPGSMHQADVIKLDDESLMVKWDKWGTECFVKNPNGVYCFKPE